MSTSTDRHEIIMEYYPMVKRIALRLASNFPSHVDAEDLTHIGMVGLIEAIDKYNPERAPSFSTYARIRVQGAILDEMRKSDWVPRSVRDRISRIQSAAEELKIRLKRAPTESEVAVHMDLTPEQFRKLRSKADIRTVLSMEEGILEDRRLGDLIPSQNEGPQEETIRSEEKEMLKKAVLRLPHREQEIVHMYYYRELTFKEIASVLHVTESRISQIHSGIKQKLKGHFNTEALGGSKTD
jgi:RNA polymerase sigma factor FliA